MWLDFMRELASIPFSPHGNCYFWNQPMIALQAGSDLAIGLAYVAISATLAYLVYRIRNIPFHWMFLAFGLFIISCGMTHFLEIWVIWEARYWLSGFIKLLTAVSSVATAVVLPSLLPKVVALYRAAELSEVRKRQLEKNHQELETLYHKVKALDEVKTRFFANISHELRTPLALVLGPAEKLLAAGGLSETQQHDLEVVARNARILLKHVNDLLDVSRLEAGKMEMHYAEVDLARLLRLTASHFDALAQERQIVYTVETPPALAVQVDADKIQCVLLNLLSNAFKFVPQQGTIHCQLKVEGDRGALTVRDSGPGVQPELRQAIFERFRQGEEGMNRRFGGTGLGLAIVKDYVDLHRGSITVAEAPEGGAAFTASVPLRAPAGTPVASAPADSSAANEIALQTLAELRIQAEAPTPRQQDDRALVLVVEDNPEMARFVAEALAADYRTAVAADGREGFEKVLGLRPDLILSDLMMPGHSGDELLHQVRARSELDTIPVVLLTAKADDDLRVRLLRAGAQDYLVKPFAVEELRVRVGNLVTMKRARDVLQQEISSQLNNLESLATEVSARKRELQTAMEAMRIARDHAERASQVKSTFLSLVSHELRTPLTAITLYLQSLTRDREVTLSPRQQDLVRRTTDSTRRLLSLIESLLDYARLQSGRFLIQVESIDLAALAAESVASHRSHAELKQLALRLAPAHDLPPLQSDPRLVQMILGNLIDNAIKFTSQGLVEVTLTHEAAIHRVAVRDTGPGIPADRQMAVFEPFEHLESVRAKHTPGVGLGLALVREMVDALKGRIELSSKEGEGSTFSVLLPARSDEKKNGPEEPLTLPAPG